MSVKKILIGFDRRLELSWLDTVATWAGADLKKDELNERYEELFANVEIGKDAKRKSKLVLSTIWLRESEELSSFNETAKKLIQGQGTNGLRIAIHWGKTIATYPFFSYVVSQVGRLFKLQGDATLAEIRRRVVEKYGDTERVKRSVRHVVQSLHSWNVISLEDKRSGKYAPVPETAVTSLDIVSWLVEAYLYGSDGAKASLSEIINSPAFFPFRLHTISLRDLEKKNPRLEIVQHSLDSNLISLKTGGMYHEK